MSEILRKYVVRNHDLIVYLSTSFVALLVFASGIGRYRTILLYAFLDIVLGIFSFVKLRNKVVYLLFGPLLLLTLYMDIMKGQILPIFPNLHFAITIIVLFVTDMYILQFVKSKLQYLSENEIFVVCPKCKYEQKKLVEKCIHCSYTKKFGDFRIDSLKSKKVINLSEELSTEIEEYKKGGLFRKPNLKLLNILNLNPSEIVLINLRMFPMRSFLKNGIRDIAKYLVITTERIFIVHYFFFDKGWRMKEIIPIDKITRVSAMMIKHFTAEEPVISLFTTNDSYEIIFGRIYPYKNKIDGIIGSIKKRRSDLEIEMDLST